MSDIAPFKVLYNVNPTTINYTQERKFDLKFINKGMWFNVAFLLSLASVMWAGVYGFNKLVMQSNRFNEVIQHVKK